MAVHLRRFIFITGGFSDNGNEPAGKVTMFDTFSFREEDVVELIHARFNHASIVLGDNLFAFGGRINASDYAGSIEILNLLKRRTWSMLIEYDEIVQSDLAAVAAISANKIIVFGGLLVD